MPSECLSAKVPIHTVAFDCVAIATNRGIRASYVAYKQTTRIGYRLHTKQGCRAPGTCGLSRRNAVRRTQTRLCEQASRKTPAAKQTRETEKKPVQRTSATCFCLRSSGSLIAVHTALSADVQRRLGSSGSIGNRRSFWVVVGHSGSLGRLKTHSGVQGGENDLTSLSMASPYRFFQSINRTRCINCKNKFRLEKKKSIFLGLSAPGAYPNLLHIPHILKFCSAYFEKCLLY